MCPRLHNPGPGPAPAPNPGPSPAPGITFAGVGNGTTVDHIEVAHNADDGVEVFGGTVNMKYVSILFAQDDGLDIDEAYT